MKKIFTFCAACLASIALFAAERTVWTGDEPISWNTEVYQGTQFETPANTFDGLQAEDTIKVTVVAHIDEPQYVLTYKAGNGWNWTDLENVSVADGLMTYVVAADSIATWIAERNLIFRGQGYNITKIAIASPEETPEPGPEPIILVEGDTTTLWEKAEGEALSWNEICEQDTAIGHQLAEKDKIIVSVLSKNPATEWPKVILRNAASEEVTNELLNEISTFPYDVVFTLTSEQAAAVQAGFRISGDGVTVTKVAAYKYKAGDDPQPTDSIDYTGLVETVVWTGNAAISWNSEEYAGDKLDTHKISETMFAGLQEGDVIRVTYAEAAEDAQFGLQYKAGEGWNWTDLAIVHEEGAFAYQVASDDMAMLIADRGIIVTGIKYHATKISVFAPDSGEGIENTNANANAKAVKLLRDGLLIIIRDGKTYNAMGVEVR